MVSLLLLPSISTMFIVYAQLAIDWSGESAVLARVTLGMSMAFFLEQLLQINS